MTSRAIAALTVASVLAAAPPALAWRTASDLPDFSDAGAVRWSSDQLRYSIVARSPYGWSDTAWLNVVGRAAGAWDGEDCGPRFSSASVPTAAAVSGDGVITVELLRSATWRQRGFDEFAAGTTDVLYVMDDLGTWRIEDAEIFIHDGVDWSGIASGGEDLESAIVHEFAHSWGGLHCCEHDGADGASRCEAAPQCADAILLPTLDSRVRRTPSEDDRGALCFLYPPQPCTGAGCPECASDAECGSGQECFASTCVDVPEPTPRCTSDSQCPMPYRCVDGHCVSGTSGDPCSSASECGSGLCRDGVCTTDCNEGCPSGFVCSADECAPSLGVLGDPCAMPRECAGGVCVEGSRSPAVCSRICIASEPCPAGWTCTEIDRRDVCVPPPAPGCAIARGRALPWWCSALAIALVARRRKR